jgi:hypothetical protein
VACFAHNYAETLQTAKIEGFALGGVTEAFFKRGVVFEALA